MVTVRLKELTNCSVQQQDKILTAIKIVTVVMNGSDFQRAVLKHTYLEPEITGFWLWKKTKLHVRAGFDGANDTSAGVYNMVMTGGESTTEEFEYIYPIRMQVLRSKYLDFTLFGHASGAILKLEDWVIATSNPSKLARVIFEKMFLRRLYLNNRENCIKSMVTQLGQIMEDLAQQYDK